MSQFRHTLRNSLDLLLTFLICLASLALVLATSACSSGGSPANGGAPAAKIRIYSEEDFKGRFVSERELTSSELKIELSKIAPEAVPAYPAENDSESLKEKAIDPRLTVGTKVKSVWFGDLPSTETVTEVSTKTLKTTTAGSLDYTSVGCSNYSYTVTKEIVLQPLSSKESDTNTKIDIPTADECLSNLLKKLFDKAKAAPEETCKDHKYDYNRKFEWGAFTTAKGRKLRAFKETLESSTKKTCNGKDKHTEDSKNVSVYAVETPSLDGEYIYGIAYASGGSWVKDSKPVNFHGLRVLNLRNSIQSIDDKIVETSSSGREVLEINQ